MKKKLLMTVAIFLISLTTTSMAEYVVTTADGGGADGGVANDTNKTETWFGGASEEVEIRHYDTVRAKAAIARFDLGDGVAGDTSGATLSITETSGNRGRTMNIYGLTDGYEYQWDDTDLTYLTVPGLLNGTDPNRDGYVDMDPAIWTLVGTMPFDDIRTTGPQVNSGLIDPNFIAADTNGTVTFLLYTSISDSAQTFYVALKENTSGYAFPTLTFPNARFATDPDPANGSTVLTSQSTLSWTNTEPNDPINGTISCDVYIGTTVPNFAEANYGLTKIATGTTSTTVTIPFALSAGTYYWVVDSYDDSSSPSFLGHGTAWSFDTTDAPQITGQPVDQIKVPGETAEFSVIVESSSTVTYTWYKSVDDVNSIDDTVVGGNSDTLTLTNVSGSDEGYYYCKAVNSSGEANAAYSNTARLVVQRQVAHWTLDSLVGGQYEDTSGESHHADPNNLNVIFVNGVNVATTNQGVVVDPNSAANAGTWDPSYVSGEFTFSFWMKWDGTGSGGFRDLLTKHNGWNAATTLWQFGLNSSNTLSLIRAGGTNVYGQVVPADTWVYVAVTFDGSTAKIYSFEVGSDGINFTVGEGGYSVGQMPDANFGIGCFYDDSGVPVEMFPGVMDEVQVFNYVKDAIAIADLYNEAVAQDFCLLAYGSSEFDLDVNDNCRIDLPDFAAIAGVWMECGLYPNCP